MIYNNHNYRKEMINNDKNYKEEMAGIETNSEIMLVYLGSPLRHDLTDVVIKRIIVNRLVFDYLSKKNTDTIYYSPLLHSTSSNLDDDYWVKHGLLMLDHCNSLLVLQLPKWQDSKGLNLEIKQAEKRNMEINYIDMDQIEIICNNNKFIPFLKDKS